MNELLGVLSLSSEKITVLLSNHKYFTHDEIVIAAKLKVINDKKSYFSYLQQGLDNRNQFSMYEAQRQGLNAFNGGYSRSLLGGIL